jgi:phospholipid/cholesterol/gamma-HCH transport system substrate-binding protein
MLTGLAFMVGLLHTFEKAYDVTAVFTDSGGIRGGDDVRVAGVKVGRVIGVDADRANGRVIVKFNVSDGVEVGEDATAEIALATLLGGAYVRIVDASAGDQLLRDLPKEERVIEYDPDTSKTPFDVFELTRVATDGINTLNKAALNDVINSVADITENQRDTITRLINAIQTVAAAVNSRDAQLQDLLDQADRVTKTLADKDETLVELVDVSQRVLDLLVERRDQLAASLGEGADVVQQLAHVISVHKTELDSILDTLHPALEVVGANQQKIDVGLAWIGPGLLQQSKGGEHGPWLDLFVRSAGPDVFQALQDLYAEALGANAAAEPAG